LISNLWDTDPIYVSNKKLKQILVLAGDGNLFKEEASQELRLFFQNRLSHHVGMYGRGSVD
jgi:hypothetical protein